MLHPASLLFFSGLPSAAAQEAGNPWWIWLIVLFALALFVAFVLWWWIYSPGAGEEEESVPAPHPAARAEVLEVEPPSIPAAPDDLKRVEGIGPKIAAVLAEAGITTFAQLAGTEVVRLRQILGDANPNLLRLADPSTWPDQARLAAEGNWADLEKLQGELKGGRRA